MHLDRRLLGWGLFFVVVGGVPLLTRAGVLDESLVERWPTLWPLLLIAWGIGLILSRTPVSWLGGGLAALTLGAMAGGALVTGLSGISNIAGCTGTEAGTAFAGRAGTIEGTGQLNVTFNCGNLAVSTADGAGWSVSGTEAEGRAPRVTVDGGRVTIEPDDPRDFFSAAGRASWNVVVPRGPRLSFGLTLNAGDGRLDLAGASLASVNATVNAGNVVLDMSGATSLDSVNATVNGGNVTISAPAGGRSMNLSINAGNADLCLPSGQAIRVNWSGALGSNDLDTAGLVKTGENTWTSAGFNASASHVALNVSANAGNFGLQFGGVCGA